MLPGLNSLYTLGSNIASPATKNCAEGGFDGVGVGLAVAVGTGVGGVVVGAVVGASVGCGVATIVR